MFRTLFRWLFGQYVAEIASEVQEATYERKEPCIGFVAPIYNEDDDEELEPDEDRSRFRSLFARATRRSH